MRFLLFLMAFSLASINPIAQCVNGQWDPSSVWVRDCTPGNQYDGWFTSGTGTATYTSATTIYQGSTARTLSWKLHYFKSPLPGAISGAKLPLLVGLHSWQDGASVSNLLNSESSLMQYEGAWEDILVLTVALENGNNLNTWWDGSKVNGAPTTWAMDGIVALVKARIGDAASLLNLAGKSVDADRVYLRGHSMGGSGTYHIGIRHPDLFAAIHAHAGFADYDGNPCGNENFCTSFTNDFIGTAAQNLQMKGIDGQNYPARLYSNMSWFVGAHNGASWAAVHGKKYEPPYVHMTHGRADAAVNISSANRLVEAMKLKRFGYSIYRNSGGHSADNFTRLHWLLGFRKNQSYLAFTDNSTDGDQVNGLNRIGWLTSSIVDQPARYQVQVTGAGTVSITPRRLQAFVIEPNRTYFYWKGAVTGSGTPVVSDPSGSLTLPAVAVSGTTTITIQPGADTTPILSPRLYVAPLALDFGAVEVGRAGSLSVTVSNTGSAPLVLSSLAAPAPFHAPALPASIAPGASAALPVTFGPTAPGTAAGSLAIGSNDAPATVALTGNGYAAPAAVASDVPILLPGPNQVTVSTAAQLVSAINGATTGRTIMLADGAYNLASLWPLRIRADSVTLYGASRDPSKVILRGTGFTSASTDEEMIKVEAVATRIAYLTLRDVRANALKIQSGGNHGLLVHNVHFIDITERAIKGPDMPVSRGGIVRYSLFEQVTPITPAIPNLNGDGDYIAGMDIMKADGWRIHDNVFRNIRGMNGGGRAGVFFWRGCKNITVERNVFVGCDRAIAFGNPSSAEVDVDTGAIRSNTIIAGRDIAIELDNSRAVQVTRNSIFNANADYFRSVYIHNSGPGNSIRENMIMGKILVTGPAPDTAGNLRVTSAGVSGRAWPDTVFAGGPPVIIRDTITVPGDTVIVRDTLPPIVIRDTVLSPPIVIRDTVVLPPIVIRDSIPYPVHDTLVVPMPYAVRDTVFIVPRELNWRVVQ